MHTWRRRRRVKTLGNFSNGPSSPITSQTPAPRGWTHASAPTSWSPKVSYLLKSGSLAEPPHILVVLSFAPGVVGAGGFNSSAQHVHGGVAWRGCVGRGCPTSGSRSCGIAGGLESRSVRPQWRWRSSRVRCSRSCDKHWHWEGVLLLVRGLLQVATQDERSTHYTLL